MLVRKRVTYEAMQWTEANTAAALAFASDAGCSCWLKQLWDKENGQLAGWRLVVDDSEVELGSWLVKRSFGGTVVHHLTTMSGVEFDAAFEPVDG